MKVVIDASFAIAALSPDEADEHAMEVLAGTGENQRLAPAIWHAELANVLVRKHRRGLMSRETAFDIWRVALKVDIATCDASPPVFGREVMPLALRHGLSSYDALYLWVALSHSASLATFDKALMRACDVEGVKVL